MTQSKSSTSKDTNKTQKNNTQSDLSKAEMDLRDEIVKEAKALANQETSSAFGIIQKTRELLKIESMLS